MLVVVSFVGIKRRDEESACCFGRGMRVGESRGSMLVHRSRRDLDTMRRRHTRVHEEKQRRIGALTSLDGCIFNATEIARRLVILSLVYSLSLHPSLSLFLSLSLSLFFLAIQNITRLRSERRDDRISGLTPRQNSSSCWCQDPTTTTTTESPSQTTTNSTFFTFSNTLVLSLSHSLSLSFHLTISLNSLSSL